MATNSKLGETMGGDVVRAEAMPSRRYDLMPTGMQASDRVHINCELDVATVGIEHTGRANARAARAWHAPKRVSLSLSHEQAGVLLNNIAGVLGAEMKVSERRAVASAVCGAMGLRAWHVEGDTLREQLAAVCENARGRGHAETAREIERAFGLGEG